jgi:hypothetical protein
MEAEPNFVYGQIEAFVWTPNSNTT